MNFVKEVAYLGQQPAKLCNHLFVYFTFLLVILHSALNLSM